MTNPRTFISLIRGIVSGTSNSTLDSQLQSSVTEVLSQIGSSVTNPTLPATTGIVTLIFDGNKDYQPALQTGNITLAASGTTSGTQKVIIDANNSGTLTVPTTWFNRNGGVFVNNQRNSYTIYRDANGIYEYSVHNDAIPDTTAPTVSRMTTNSNGSQVIITTNENLTTTPLESISAFTLSGGRTITGVAMLNNSITLSVTPSYIASDSITLGYTAINGIKDLAGNSFANFSPTLVTNNVASFSNTRSVNITATNQIVKTPSTVNNLNFYSAGGTDLPFTATYRVKMSANVANSTVFAYGYADSYHSIISANQIYFTIKDASDVGLTVRTGTLANGVWYHVMCVYTGSRTSAGVKIYIDNVDSTLSIGSASNGGLPITDKVFTVGGYSNDTNISANMLLDELAIISGAADSTQRIALYNGGETRDYKLIAGLGTIKTYLRFEQNLIDIGTNANTFSSVAAPGYSTDKP